MLVVGFILTFAIAGITFGRALDLDEGSTNADGGGGSASEERVNKEAGGLTSNEEKESSLEAESERDRAKGGGDGVGVGTGVVSVLFGGDRTYKVPRLDWRWSNGGGTADARSIESIRNGET